MLGICNRAVEALTRRLRVAGLLVVAAVVLPVTLLLGAGTASAQPAPTQPPGSPPSGTIVAVEGTDGAAWIKANVPYLGFDYVNRAPNQWYSLGGVVQGAPDVVNVNDEPWYVATGSDGNIWIRTIDTAWNKVSPGVDCIGSPGTTYLNGNLYVACEGTDQAMWVATVSTSSNPSGFPLVALQSYGGVIINGPTVASVGGFLNFLAPGPGGQVWYHGPTVNSPWIATNANCPTGHLAADSDSTNLPGGACAGPDGQAWASYFPAVPIVPPFNVAQGGQLLGGPGYANNNYDQMGLGQGVVFAEGTDQGVWYHFQTRFLGDSSFPTYLWFGLGGAVADNTGAEAAFFSNSSS